MKACLSEPACPVAYRPHYREYVIWMERPTDDDFGRAQTLSFCPWCGSKLPASLRDALFDELEDLAGGEIDDYFLALTRAPSKYRSAGWWQDRYDFDGNLTLDDQN